MKNMLRYIKFLFLIMLLLLISRNQTFAENFQDIYEDCFEYSKWIERKNFPVLQIKPKKAIYNYSAEDSYKALYSFHKDNDVFWTDENDKSMFEQYYCHYKFAGFWKKNWNLEPIRAEGASLCNGCNPLPKGMDKMKFLNFLWGYWAVLILGLPAFFSILEILILVYIKGINDGGGIFDLRKKFSLFIIPNIFIWFFLLMLLPDSWILGEDKYYLFLMPVFCTIIFILGKIYLNRLYDN